MMRCLVPSYMQVHACLLPITVLPVTWHCQSATLCGLPERDSETSSAALEDLSYTEERVLIHLRSNVSTQLFVDSPAGLFQKHHVLELAVQQVRTAIPPFSTRSLHHRQSASSVSCEECDQSACGSLVSMLHAHPTRHWR